MFVYVCMVCVLVLVHELVRVRILTRVYVGVYLYFRVCVYGVCIGISS